MPKWLLFSLMALVLWGGWGFASRKLGDALSGEQTLVVSTFAMLPIIGVLALRRPLTPTLSPDGREGIALRGAGIAVAAGLVGGFGNLAFYRLLNAGERAATVVPLTAMYPLVTVILAVIILRERLSAAQVGGILLAAAAIYFFNVGREAGFWNRWLAFAVLPLLLWGVAGLLQKISTHDLSADRSCLWFLVGYLPVGVFVGFKASIAGLSLNVWLWGLAIGLLLGLGNLTVLAAYARGKASIITPLTALYPAVTVPLAVIFLHEKVATREWMGIGLSLAAVVALSREQQSKPSQPAVLADVTGH